MTVEDAQRQARRETLAIAVLFCVNFTIGLGNAIPPALINQLSEAFQTSIPRTATLVGYGALVICIAAPLCAYLTNRIQRHLLLSVSLLVFGAAHFVSMFVTEFDQLLALRILLCIPMAIVTPQVAGTLAQFLKPERLPVALAVSFAGWNVAAALGFPLVTILATEFGWPAAYGLVAGSSVLVSAALWLAVPHRLVAPPLSLAAWKEVFSTRAILLVAAIAFLSNTGQFALYPFIAADLKQSFAVSPSLIALLFSAFGIAGVVGTVFLTQIIGRIGTSTGVTLFSSLVALSLFLWFAGHAWLPVLVFALLLFGFSYPPAASLQQARLIANAPLLASAAIAVNFSLLYVAQAAGTFIGGGIITHASIAWLGLGAAAIAVTAPLLSVYIHRHWKI